MKTLIDAILNHFEICEDDAQKTCRDIVIQECDDAKCACKEQWCYIKSDNRRLGYGRTKDTAWENAALNVLRIMGR